MANFDALRSAIIGPLEYICRPKVKPAELQALFPLDNSTVNLANTAYTITSSSFIDGVFSGTKAGASVSGVYALGSVWTIDFYTKWVQTSKDILTLNTRKVSTATQDGKPRYLWNGSNLAANLTSDSWHHIALTCDGTSMYAYFDGTRQSTITATATSATFNSGNNGMSSIRIVSKCLTTGSTFPVPSDLYTGYEPL